MGGFERNATMWDVTFPACGVGPDGRYRVEQETKLSYGGTRRYALWAATVHMAALIGLPPWRPWTRELAKRASVQRRVETIKLGT